MGWTIGVLGFDSRRGLGIFLFTTASSTALGPTQPPIQWVPGALSLGVKRPGREADHSLPFSAEVKEWVEPYLHSPDKPSWRGAQLKQGTTLLLLYLCLSFLTILPFCFFYLNFTFIGRSQRTVYLRSFLLCIQDYPGSNTDRWTTVLTLVMVFLSPTKTKIPCVVNYVRLERGRSSQNINGNKSRRIG
jgi:hypothetical protein